MAELTNNVVVEGILSEVNLEDKPFMRNGSNVNSIRGDIRVKVVMPLTRGAEPTELEVPIRFFVAEYSNSGNLNSQYTRLKEFMETANPIAKVGEDSADCIRVTGCRVRMQEYYTPDGRLISFPSIDGSFINTIKRSDMVMKAQATVEGIIVNMDKIYDKDGVETDTMCITTALVGFNDYIDVVPFITSNPQYIAAINATYKPNDYVKIQANLNFSYKVETFYKEVEIGDPIESTRTVNVSDLIITGLGSADTVDGTCDESVLAGYLRSRDERLAGLKARAASKQTTESARSKNVEQKKKNLGF